MATILQNAVYFCALRRRRGYTLPTPKGGRYTVACRCMCVTKGSRVFSSPPFPSSLPPCYEGRRNSVRNTGVSRHFSHGRLTPLGPADRAKEARPSYNTPTRENSRANPDRLRGRPPPHGLKLDESMPFKPKP